MVDVWVFMGSYVQITQYAATRVSLELMGHFHGSMGPPEILGPINLSCHVTPYWCPSATATDFAFEDLTYRAVHTVSYMTDVVKRKKRPKRQERKKWLFHTMSN